MIKHATVIQVKFTLGHLSQRNENLCSLKMYMNVHRIFIFSSTKWKQSRCPSMSEWTLWQCPYHVTLLNNKQEWKTQFQHIFSSFFFFLAAPHSMWNFPNQGSNPYPLQWKRRVLTAGPPGKSLQHSWIAKNRYGEQISDCWGFGIGVGRWIWTTEGILEVMALFCTLNVSLSICWLWFCTIVLLNVTSERNCLKDSWHLSILFLAHEYESTK